MKMILLLVIGILAINAQAINRTFLLMPADREYMNFVMEKYLSWHQKHFDFPGKPPLFEALISHIDNYVVKGTLHRQLTMSHGVDETGNLIQSLRVFVHPDLRLQNEFKGRGLPDPKHLWFVEWDSTGKTCQLYREKEKELTSFCRKTTDKKFELAWTEREARDFPAGWAMPFPRMSVDVILRYEKGELIKVSFFQISAHPSRIPNQLIRSVFLHTKDALFPLERISVTRDGVMTIHYP